MKVVLTGAGGFLGWHTQVRLRARTDHQVSPVSRSEWHHLEHLLATADAVIHVAGVNRAADDVVLRGNVELAEELRAAVLASGGRPRLVFANSVRADESGPYGEGKARASKILAELAGTLGSTYVDVRLPNLFGEYGRPRYNSFVATFVEAVAAGRPSVVEDRPIRLLHVQSAAQALIDALEAPAGILEPNATPTSVGAVHRRLTEFHALYRNGGIPPLANDLDIDLFNTLRAAMFPAHYPIRLASRTDGRGSLVEVVRAAGSPGQTFVSTTRPGATRGEHFHLRKVERFVVLSGQAQISLRRLLTGETVTFSVDGVRPAIVDMPTMWAHNLLNTGSSHLTTLFWTNELFDPGQPDTYAEPVVPTETSALAEAVR